MIYLVVERMTDISKIIRYFPRRIYYDTFTPYLNECKSADFKYAFEDFIEDYNFHKPVGFTTACSVMPNVMSNTQVDLETTGNMLKKMPVFFFRVSSK